MGYSHGITNNWKFMKTLLITLSTIGIACCATGIVLVNSMRPVPLPLDHAPTLSAQHAPKYVLNYTNVYAEIMRNDIKFSEIVLRQTVIESGHYKSHNCKSRNNITGMKGGEVTTDNPEGYKIFDSWMDCIENYKSWQYKRLTEYCNDYYQFLHDWGYHEGGDGYRKKCEGVKLVVVKI